MTTFFQFTETSYLPLPTPRHTQSPSTSPPTSTTTTQPPPIPPNETSDDILQRGLRTALQMLHTPELMIALNPLVQHYTRIRSTDPADSKRLVNLPRFAPEFNVLLPTPHSVSSWSESTNGQFVHYEIIDKFNMMFGAVSKLLTYKACFRPLYPDRAVQTSMSSTLITGTQSIGLETISDPGQGISLLGKWTLSLDETRPGFIVLSECVNVHCGMLFGWFIRGQLETAHAALHKEFGRRFVMRMIEGDPMRGKDVRGGRSWGEVRNGLDRVGSGSSVGSAAGVGGIGNMSTNQGVNAIAPSSMNADRSVREQTVQRQGSSHEPWRNKEIEVDIEAMERETRERNQRPIQSSGRDAHRDGDVSSIGDDNEFAAAGGKDYPAPLGLRRSRTNESGVSDMR